MAAFITLSAVGYASAQTASASPDSTTNSSPAASPAVQDKRTAMVLRFALANEASATSKTLAEQACPVAPSVSGSVPSDASSSSDGESPKADLKVDPKIQDDITAELEKKLSKKMTVIPEVEQTAVPEGVLVFTGCITRSDPGNAAERLVGLNLGASHLGAHVKVLRKTKDGFEPVDEFDVQAKGAKALPPLGIIGLATHAAAERRETLSADAKKMSDDILKKLQKDMKARTEVAKAS
jgi:hypothetical protein